MPARTIAKAVLTALIAIAVVVATAPPAEAQNPFERLVSPGELVKGHAKYEKDCQLCHKPFDKGAQTRLCLDCHKQIAGDLAAKQGWHGRSPEVAGAACSYCHDDHKGRGADIVLLDRQTFDHGRTDFALVGAHTSVACSNCHVEGKAYRDAKSACVACHNGSDPHRGALGASCGTCHAEKAWRPIKGFDHTKTRFPLTGSHSSVACRTCHAAEQWKGLTSGCVDCHGRHDKHKGANGPACQSCHKTTSWAALGFDHDTDTKFPLAARHRTASCESCHKQDPKLVKLAPACMPCHARDDVHKGGLGRDCQRCHNESGWKVGVLFDHDRDTKFALLGKHATTSCADCHKSPDHRAAPKSCSGCHASKDSHRGRLGPKCESCHNADTWKRASFDHARQAHYPLTGKHATASCYACHSRPQPEKVSLPHDCIACHRKDDRHKGAFGKDCSKCHSTSTFTNPVIPR